ncbi:MAG: glycosyltransferase family 4 protein [Methylovirgula sp.]|nr:glycosyltransferase family 4 protein [Methylovirgula sp.]
MRILLNDYSGHAFTVELARELAKRGHDVLHLSLGDFQSPKGDLARKPDDPKTFEVEAISLGVPFKKYDFVARRRQEIEYGRRVTARIAGWHPDVVVGCNNPLDPQRVIQNYCRARNICFVFWLQDIYSNAIKAVLKKKIPVVGHAIGIWYEELEKRLLRRSDQVIAITEDFIAPLVDWNVPRERISVIENWAPKDKILILPRDNPWSRAHDLNGKFVLMYSGTLGLKHNPSLLVATAEAFRAEPEVAVVVVSEGKYADEVRDTAKARGLSNLTVLPFQDFRDYSAVLATGDVMLAMIEPDAAVYSVPSKVLSYLCAGKAIVLSANAANLAARILMRSGAGYVVAPQDEAGFVAAIRRFLKDPEARHQAGIEARAYADENFDIALIAARFETILAGRVRPAVPA